MRLISWNINHRARERPIRPGLADSIASLEADVVVLTEYVPALSREPFLADLADHGLPHIKMSAYTKGQNHVLIASRMPLEERSIRGPAIAPSLPSNVLHVSLLSPNVEILGIRVPDYSRKPQIRRAIWDWIIETGKHFVDRPFVMIGDFNTDPRYPKAKCGPKMAELEGQGWQRAIPAETASFWTLNGNEVCIDHAFVSKHLAIQNARYVSESGGFTFAGHGKKGLSDHAVLMVDIIPITVKEVIADMDLFSGQGFPAGSS